MRARPYNIGLNNITKHNKHKKKKYINSGEIYFISFLIYSLTHIFFYYYYFFFFNFIIKNKIIFLGFFLFWIKITWSAAK